VLSEQLERTHSRGGRLVGVVRDAAKAVQDVILRQLVALGALRLGGLDRGGDFRFPQVLVADAVGGLGAVPGASGGRGGVEVDEVLADEGRLLGCEWHTGAPSAWD